MTQMDYEFKNEVLNYQNIVSLCVIGHALYKKKVVQIGDKGRRKTDVFEQS